MLAIVLVNINMLVLKKSNRVRGSHNRIIMSANDLAAAGPTSAIHSQPKLYIMSPIMSLR